MKKRKFFLISVLIFVLFLSGCSIGTPDPVSDTTFALNTSVTIRICEIKDCKTRSAFTDRAEELISDAFLLCRSYEAVFSRTASSSELYSLNEKDNAVSGEDGSLTCNVSDELAEVIGLGLSYSAASGGAFDITVAPLSDLWNFTAENPHVPDESDILEVLPAIDYQLVSLSGNEVTFKDPDVKLDLGGIAKGYIADKLAEMLREEGVTSAIINLGGDVYCIGSRTDGDPFLIGIKDPFSDESESILNLYAGDAAVVSSGTYERCFTEEGKTYHHLLNPDTGYPYDNGLVSVTVIAPSAADADALSTACFALGEEEGIAMLDSVSDTYGIFIREDGSILSSAGAEDFFAE